MWQDCGDIDFLRELKAIKATMALSVINCLRRKALFTLSITVFITLLRLLAKTIKIILYKILDRLIGLNYDISVSRTILGKRVI